jgi:hypothetical protein
LILSTGPIQQPGEWDIGFRVAGFAGHDTLLGAEKCATADADESHHVKLEVLNLYPESDSGS